jgi:hypothetical protein
LPRIKGRDGALPYEDHWSKTAPRSNGGLFSIPILIYRGIGVGIGIAIDFLFLNPVQ